MSQHEIRSFFDNIQSWNKIVGFFSFSFIRTWRLFHPLTPGMDRIKIKLFSKYVVKIYIRTFTSKHQPSLMCWSVIQLYSQECELTDRIEPVQDQLWGVFTVKDAYYISSYLFSSISVPYQSRWNFIISANINVLTQTRVGLLFNILPLHICVKVYVFFSTYKLSLVTLL